MCLISVFARSDASWICSMSERTGRHLVALSVASAMLTCSWTRLA